MIRLLRWALMILGILYLWALLPVSFRPQLPGSPLRKSDPTVSVPAGTTLKANAALLKDACAPSGLLKPVMSPARQVVVRYVSKGTVESEHRVRCP